MTDTRAGIGSEAAASKKTELGVEVRKAGINKEREVGAVGSRVTAGTEVITVSTGREG